MNEEYLELDFIQKNKVSADYLNMNCKEIQFEKFGGRQLYFKHRDIYWYKRFNNRSYFETGIKFNMSEEEVIKYCRKFEKYLNEPIHYYDFIK